MDDNQRFTPGERVKISQRSTAPREDYPGESGEFIGYTSPHGYARVQLDKFAGQQLIHPENLVNDEQKRSPQGSDTPRAS